MDPRFEALPPGPPPPKKTFLQNIGAWIVGAVVAFFKFGFLLIKSLKTSLSLFLMIWVYSLLFGWPFAIGIAFLILMHEMGHVVAAKLLGMPVSLPMFIPMFGAYTTLKQNPPDAWTGGLFASGGPIAGAILGWICLLLGLQYHATFLVAIASVNFVFNLFNMIPVPPFDGGGMCGAISRWFWLVGLVLLGLALIYFHSLFMSIFIIVIVFFMTLPRIQQTFLMPPSEEEELYYSTHISNRLAMAVIYLGVFAALLLGYGHASGYLTSVLGDIYTNHSGSTSSP
jgi:Zn-dependent protease